MKKALIIIAFLAAVALGLVLYSGICYSVSVTEREIGPYAMVLKKHIGSYYKTGSVFEEVGEVLGKKIDIKTLKGAGLYYDDPAKVKEEVCAANAVLLSAVRFWEKSARLMKAYSSETSRKKYAQHASFQSKRIFHK